MIWSSVSGSEPFKELEGTDAWMIGCNEELKINEKC